MVYSKERARSKYIKKLGMTEDEWEELKSRQHNQCVVCTIEFSKTPERRKMLMEMDSGDKVITCYPCSMIIRWMDKHKPLIKNAVDLIFKK